MRMIVLTSKIGNKEIQRRGCHYSKTKFSNISSRDTVTLGINPSILRHGNRKFRQQNVCNGSHKSLNKVLQHKIREITQSWNEKRSTSKG